MDKTKTLQVIGMCQKAKKLTTGEEFVLNKIRSGEAKIVFLACDAGKNTTKRITDKCKYYEVFLNHELSSQEINAAIGKNNRKVLSISDMNFVKMIEKHLN